MKRRILSIILAVVMIAAMFSVVPITASAAAEIPTSYSSKEKGYTTEVKNQYNTSCSWAYSTVSMLETFLKKNNMYEGALSPLHMAYAQSSDRDAGWVARRGFLTSGGDSTMAIGFCTSPIGFRESYLEDPEVMDISKEITPELEAEYRGIARNFDINSEKKFVVNSIAFLDPEDTDAIKNAIMKYGSASVTFRLSYDNFNENRDAYYASEQPGEDSSFLHSVLVIGWDDEFSRDNFAQKPENNGAWLCQSSWGADAGNDGCFYVSYDDVSFLDSGERIWAIEKAEKDDYTDNFYTLNENCGVMSDYTAFNKLRIVDFCNKYTFRKYEMLEKVSFESPSVGAEYTIFVIPALDNGTPSKDNWIEIGRGRILHAGYTCTDVKDVDVSEKTCFIGIRLSNSIPNIKMGITTDTDGYFIHKNGQAKTSFTRKTDQDFYELSNPDNENAYFAINVVATRIRPFYFYTSEDSITTINCVRGEKATKPDYYPDDHSVVWYKEEERINPWNFDTDVVGTISVWLYAKLFERYPVMLNSDGGVGGTESIKVGYGDDLPEIEVPTKDGFVFDGYYDENGVQYYDADGKALKVWDKDSESEELFAGYLSTAHVHTFADTYTYNETHHWHVCTADDCYIKNYATCGIKEAAYGKHVFDESGHCVCGAIKSEYSVTFDLQGHGTAAPSSQKIDSGGKVTKPTPDPTAEGFTFDGWYKEANCVTPWNFDTDTVSENTVLYAKWSTCQHYYVDYICKYCHAENLEGAKNDAVRVIQNTVDHSEDAVLKLLEENAVDAIKSVDKVAEAISARDYWLTAINKQLGTSTHTHTFADTYTHNDTHHWRVCTCEGDDCKGNVTGFGTHTFDSGVEDGIITTYTCTECGYQKTVLKCDINKDGKIDASDLILLEVALLSGCDYYGALDCNGDGSFNILDMVKLKKCCAYAAASTEKQENSKQAKQFTTEVANIPDNKQFS